MSFTHHCSSCAEPLPTKHLRVQLAPPDKPWYMLRVHDLACLLDWLEDEEDGEGRLFQVPSRR